MHRALTNQIIEELPDAAKIPGRCVDNMAVMVLGIEMFRAFARGLGARLPLFDIQPAIKACLANVLDGDRAAKDPFDHFVEQLAVIARLGRLEEGRHYASVDGQLCLCVPLCYAAYLEERRRQGVADQTHGIAALRRIAREKRDRDSYVVAVDKRVRLRDGFSRTVVIDPMKLPVTMEAEFPVMNERSWGGSGRSGGGWDPDE